MGKGRDSNSAWRITGINEAALALTRRTRAQVIGRAAQDLVPQIDAAVVLAKAAKT